MIRSSVASRTLTTSGVSLAAVLALGIAGVADAALVAHYTFDDATDSATADGAQNLTLNGNASISGGKLLLDGTGDYAKATSNLIAGASGVTITSWFVANAETTSAIAQMPIVNGNGTTQSAASLELVVQENSAGLAVQGGGRSGSGTADGFQSGLLGFLDIDLGTAYFSATVLDYVGKVVSVYLYDPINDTWHASHTPNRLFSATTVAGETGLNVGRRADGQRYFNGALDELRVYNTALTEAQVQGVVPEPASLALLGAAGLLALARRRD